MKRCMRYAGVWLAVGMLVSCGGGGGGGGDSPGAPPAVSPSPAVSPPPANGGGTGLPSAGARIEESNTQFVTFSGDWKSSDPHGGWSGSTFDSVVGWSGGAAKESSQPGATASFTFTGTSVRWLSMRGRNGGIALVRVDGGPAQKVDLFGRPSDEFRTPAITIYGLSAGQHTLTIEVTGRTSSTDASTAVVVVDAFEVEPQIVSHAQDSDPNSDLTYIGDWVTQDNSHFGWSGSAAFNLGETPPGAHVTATKDASVTYKFRGTGVSWIGYSGPDAGIADVTVDGIKTTVDTYSRDLRVQQVLFTASGLTDAVHTLTITATGKSNARSSAAQIFVDAFDVTTPGRRYEQGDPTTAPQKHISFDQGLTTIDYVGSWDYSNSRVWTEGWAATTQETNATVTFVFTGTSVSWIGCEKSSAGVTARVFIDDVFDKEVNLFQPMPMEGYQREVYRKDGLSPGPHKLKILVTSTDKSFVVIDAFDVRQ